MAIFGTLATVRTQLIHPGHFAASLALVEDAMREGTAVRTQLFALAVGTTDRIDLPGGAFAILQCYKTKARTEGIWETHRAYIDVQVMYAGEEFMEVSDRSKMVVKEDLTPTKDLIFYQPFTASSVLRLTGGDVAVYFPPDAHMGSLSVTSSTEVRKIVVKVPALA